MRISQNHPSHGWPWLRIKSRVDLGGGWKDVKCFTPATWHMRFKQLGKPVALVFRMGFHMTFGDFSGNKLWGFMVILSWNWVCQVDQHHDRWTAFLGDRSVVGVFFPNITGGYWRAYIRASRQWLHHLKRYLGYSDILIHHENGVTKDNGYKLKCQTYPILSGMCWDSAIPKCIYIIYSIILWNRLFRVTTVAFANATLAVPIDQEKYHKTTPQKKTKSSAISQNMSIIVQSLVVKYNIYI